MSLLPLRDEVALPIRARYHRWEAVLTQQMNGGTNEGPSRALSLTPTHKCGRTNIQDSHTK